VTYCLVPQGILIYTQLTTNKEFSNLKTNFEKETVALDWI